MKICELFYSIEGEGLWIGLPSAVLRLSGCNRKCAFCDTKFSSWWSNDTEDITFEEAIKRLSVFPTNRLSITGGEPLFRPEEELREVVKVIDHFQKRGYQIKIETNGDIIPDALSVLGIFWSVSPKLAGMGAKEPFNTEALSRHFYLHPEKMQLKFVVGSRMTDSTMEADLDQIRTIIMEFPVIKEHQIPVILQPEGLTENLSEYAVRLADLMERMSFNNNIDVGFWKDINVRWKDINVRVLPQVHRIAWMNRRQV